MKIIAEAKELLTKAVKTDSTYYREYAESLLKKIK